MADALKTTGKIPARLGALIQNAKKGEAMMPLTLAVVGEENIIKKIGGRQEVDCTSLCGQHKNGGLSRNI